MTRVTRRSASVLARRSPGRVAKRNSRKHKVILESVTQAKKKLRSVISFEAKAPPGYTFIPAGNPHFTTACKELCRKDGMKVYAVSITINTEARDVLKDLFPNIPDNDLNQIIKTAFQKGQRKVGTAVELPLARRAQLAVVAHIRHIYTNYDRLLKSTSFHEARASVEQPTLAKLVEWRGDDENGKTVLEDVFREVIVISDDEDSDLEVEPQPAHGRDTSVEVISSNPVVEELQMGPLNHGSAALRGTQAESLEDDALPGFRFIPEVPRRTRVDRRGFSRYQAWDRAINRYKNFTSGPSQQAPPYSAGDPFQGNRGYDRESSARRLLETRQSSIAPFIMSNQRAVTTNLSRPAHQPVAEHRRYELYPLTEVLNKPKDAPGPINPPNLVSLERAPIFDAVRPPVQQPDLSNRPVFVSGPKGIHERDEDTVRSPPRPPGHLHSRNASQQERVLPSIESPLPVEIKRPSSGHIEHLTKRMSGAFSFRSVTPHRQAHQDFSNHNASQESIHDQASKRRRVAYYEPIPMENPITTNTSPSLGAYTGNRYATTQSFPSGPHSRRRCVASFESPRIADHRPKNVEDPSISFTRFDREPHILAHQRPPKDYNTQPLSSSRPVNPRVTHHISPGQTEPRVEPDTRYSHSVSSGLNRKFQAQTPEVLEPRTFQSVHEPTLNGVRASDVVGGLHESVWWNREPPGPYRPADKQSTYAPDFVRPVDNRDPNVSEYKPTHRPPPSQIVDSPTQPAQFRFQGDQNQHVPSDGYPLIPPRGRAHLEPQVQVPPRQHPIIGSQGPKYLENKQYIIPPPVHQERQSQNALPFLRTTYDHHQRIHHPDQRPPPPVYMKTAEDARHQLPRSRTLLIMD